MTLPVRSRTLLHPDGAERVEHSIRCPERRATVALGTCERCPASTGVFEGPRVGTFVVDCDFEPPAASSSDLLERPVGELASTDVVCALPETTAQRAQHTLRERAIGCLPIVDEHRNVRGLVSPADLLAAAPEARLDSLMTKQVVTFSEEVPLARAAATLAFEGIHHAPLVDENGKLIGVLSSLDILRAIGEQGRDMVPRETRRQRAPRED
jgi:CBS domain-containing protein